MDTDPGSGRGGPGGRAGRRDGRPIVPPAQHARPSGPLGARETSGVQVRLGTRGGRARGPGGREPVPGGRVPGGRPGEYRPYGGRPPRRRRRTGIAVLGTAAVLAAAGGGAALLWPGGNEPGVPASPQTKGTSAEVDGRLPRTGTPVEVGTADGSRYRIAAVTWGLTGGGQARATGGRAAYIDYVLTNPSGGRVLLDFPGDVFLKRTLVAQQARGRCMWQAGVPEDMCTPPIRSAVVRRLAGEPPAAGEGGDTYLPPGASVLVRATVEVPVSDRIRRDDLRLYIWKQLYMADQLAKRAPFPG
ncbi:hypothetical protein [Actinomadura sp. 21ATH]|uniref:hypothetical protein n=1 Tax=Actinomadura sp. 21ATH TaxID=1735444 RepID=UPI0035C11CEA